MRTLAGQGPRVALAAPGASVLEGKDPNLCRSQAQRRVAACPQGALSSSFQLWRDLIDSLVGYSLWLRALLGLPEKETIYLDMPEELGQTLRGPPARRLPHPVASALHTLWGNPCWSLEEGPAPLLAVAKVWNPEVILESPGFTSLILQMESREDERARPGVVDPGTRSRPLALAPQSPSTGPSIPPRTRGSAPCGNSPKTAESAGSSQATVHTVFHSPPQIAKRLPS